MPKRNWFNYFFRKEIIVEKVQYIEVPVINEFSGRESMMLEIDRLKTALNKLEFEGIHWRDAYKRVSYDLNVLREAVKLAKTIQFGGKANEPNSGE